MIHLKSSHGFLSVQPTSVSSKTLFPDTEFKLIFFFSALALYTITANPSGNISLLFIIFFSEYLCSFLSVSFNSSPFRPNKCSSCHLTFKVVFLNNKTVLNIVESRQRNASEIPQLLSPKA